MRICCVSNMYPSDRHPDYGAFVADMCGELEARGHTVVRAVITDRASGPVHTPLKYARLLAASLRAARRADVVYAHYLFPTGAIAWLAARLAGAPCVVTAHGGDVANLTDSRIRRMTAAVIGRVAGLIAVSRDLVDRLEGAGLRHPRTTVVNMGVDTARFAPADRTDARRRLGLPPDSPLVLAVGGLTDRKDPLALIRAAAGLRDLHPDLQLAFVGDGPLADRLAPMAAELGFPAGQLHRPGVLPHAAVADWMAACDVLSMVSRIEPLGVVALEALAADRPVVATSVGGAAEVVPADGPGRIVTPGDTSAHTTALADLLSTPPAPGVARAAAMDHALTRQAERIAGYLRDTVDTATAGRIRRP